MSWTDLKPVLKSSGSALVSAFLGTQGKKDKVHLIILISPFIAKHFGECDHVVVQYGSGEHAECVRLVSAAETSDETHKLQKAPHGFRKLILPLFDGLPNGVGARLSCRVLSEKDSEVVIKLPVADWEVEISRAQKAPARTASGAVLERPTPISAEVGPKTTGPTPRVEPATTGNSVDISMYLQNKRHKVERLAMGAYFNVDGERKTKAEAVDMINGYRERSNLTSIDVSGAF